MERINMLIYDKVDDLYGKITCEVDFWQKPSTLILNVQGKKYTFTREGNPKSGSPFDKEMLIWCQRNHDRLFDILIEWESGNDEVELINDPIFR